jgi:uncharacterized membrane protein YidH (DUF202 family)
MSSYHRSRGESDESTPIRTGDGHSDRRYDGTNETNSSGTVTNSAAASSSQPSSSTLVSSTPDGLAPPNGEHGDTKQKDGGSEWLKKLSEKYGSVTLENKGAVARDHLALERTFLAWLRTSLAFASIGIAVTQLFRLNTTLQSRNESMLSIRQTMPLSPLIGESVPAEMVPFLQQVAASISSLTPPSTLGPTLLDQLLGLPPAGVSRRQLGGLAGSTGGASNVIHVTDDATATKLRHVGKPLGATFIAIAIVILFIGFHRYFEAQHWIMKGKFPASRGSIFAVTFMTGSLIIASLVVVLAIASAPLQKKR